MLYRTLLVHFPLYKHEGHCRRKWTGSCYKTSEELIFSDGGNRGAVKWTWSVRDTPETRNSVVCQCHLNANPIKHNLIKIRSAIWHVAINQEHQIETKVELYYHPLHNVKVHTYIGFSLVRNYPGISTNNVPVLFWWLCFPLFKFKKFSILKTHSTYVIWIKFA